MASLLSLPQTVSLEKDQRSCEFVQFTGVAVPLSDLGHFLSVCVGLLFKCSATKKKSS